MEETGRLCHRCDEPIPERSAESLCAACFEVLGPREEPTDVVCYYCGIVWHAVTLPMCQECYIQEGKGAILHFAH